MATFALSTEYTMLEVAKSIGAEGNDLMLVDTLSQRTPFLEEGYWMEADDFNSHHFLQALYEPAGTDSVINVGIAWEVFNSTPVTEFIQGIESFMRIDTRILSRKRNPQLYIKQQTEAFIRGLKKTVHDRILYGNNGTTPDQINGLTTRFTPVSIATWPWGNVTSNGGSTGTSQSSTWTIKWGPDGVFFVYPHGGQDFIKMTEYGEQLVYDTNTKPYTALVFRFLISFGLCVADPRNCQRLCNIDATTTWLIAKQMLAFSALPSGLDGAVLYVPRRVYAQMNAAAVAVTNVIYSTDEVWGRPVLTIQGIPIVMCERLTATEAVVTA